MNRGFLFLGLVLFFLGIGFAVNAMSAMTGLVVSEEVSQRGSSFFGLSFMLIGLFVLFLSKHKAR